MKVLDFNPESLAPDDYCSTWEAVVFRMELFKHGKRSEEVDLYNLYMYYLGIHENSWESMIFSTVIIRVIWSTWVKLFVGWPDEVFEDASRGVRMV